MNIDLLKLHNKCKQELQPTKQKSSNILNKMIN